MTLVRCVEAIISAVSSELHVSDWKQEHQEFWDEEFWEEVLKRVEADFEDAKELLDSAYDVMDVWCMIHYTDDQLMDKMTWGRCFQDRITAEEREGIWVNSLWNHNVVTNVDWVLELYKLDLD